MNEKDAKKEALRLNRLYANQYKCYRRAIKNLPKALELQKQKDQLLAKQIAQKDKKNAYIDELTDMCWYTYDHVTLRKAYIDKLVKDTLKEPKTTDNCSLNNGELNRLTQDELYEVIYYDAFTGEFEWNTGVISGKKVKLTQLKPKPLRKQNAYALPLKPRTYKPAHAGYNIISEQEYLRVMSGADDKKDGLKYTGYGYTAHMVRPSGVYKRQYLVRTKGGKNPDTQATQRITYYVKENNNPYPRIKVKGKVYTAHSIATLYMGAGGDWDYSGGLDNIKKHAEHTLIAPYGLKQYNPHTNRPMLMQCRDGDRLNLKWENIKPKYNIDSETNLPDFSTASILKDPTAKQPEAVKIVKRRMYSHTRNIKEIYLPHDRFNARYTLVHMGSAYFCGWTHEEAVAEFDKRLDAMRGYKQRVRSGDIMVVG